jgi:hypothetical protein
MGEMVDYMAVLYTIIYDTGFLLGAPFDPNSHVQYSTHLCEGSAPLCREDCPNSP